MCQEGCSIGKANMTTQRILDLCELYDCFDLDASGLLDADDLIMVAQAAGYKISQAAMENWIKTLPRNHSEQTGFGVDFPLFLQIASAEASGNLLERINCNFSAVVIESGVLGNR